jgi:hypothetical protein
MHYSTNTLTRSTTSRGAISAAVATTSTLNFTSSHSSLSSLSLNELSSFIRSNIHRPPPPSADSITNESKSSKLLEIAESAPAAPPPPRPLSKRSLLAATLTAPINDKDAFAFVVSAFRLCTFMLPPTNKRKLHLLLRFLHKLKNSKHTAKYLNNDSSGSSSDDSFFAAAECDDEDDINYIDTSALMTISKTATTRHKHSATSDVEAIIIRSFLGVIVDVDETRATGEVHPEQLAIKLVQILIDNYTEIMRIPDELIVNVKQKIHATRRVSSTGMSHSNSNRINHPVASSTMNHTIDQHDTTTINSQLSNILTHIIADVNMSEREKIARLRQFKENYPHIYDERHPTIKKALSVLGIDEKLATTTSASAIQAPLSSDMKSSKSGGDLVTEWGGVKRQLSHIADKISSTSTANQLNQTTTTVYTNTNTFPRLFNKIKKRDSAY